VHKGRGEYEVVLGVWVRQVPVAQRRSRSVVAGKNCDRRQTAADGGRRWRIGRKEWLTCWIAPNRCGQ